MKAEIHQTFGHIQGGDLMFPLKFVGKHTLMHAGPVIGKMENRFQFFLDIVCIQDCQLAGLF